MLFQTAENFLSAARLAPYKAASHGDEQVALELYIDNLRVGKEFHMLLALFEVAFRNALHTALARQFGSENWLLEQQNGFMRDRAVLLPNSAKSKALQMVEAAGQEYRKQRNQAAPHGTALIASLSFGFWTTLFTTRYYFLLHRAPLNAFRQRPRGTDWTTIRDWLTEVRHFRNRVYHHEPLCLNKTTGAGLCLSELANIHSRLTELLRWLDPSLEAWAHQIDAVPGVLQQLRGKYQAAV